ncbi:glutamate 5-kinase [Agarivorans sp. Toyoura001]|uniref:glutamate 5-kinase n=1 Tax=Agarivorans sp. Toyoura001 TaxID=2283141 RepID=UPI0010EBF35E|nr:glutamate 5-kinase [Agarivorans sp. Toyoura001]GDY24369.1 glutamate 5-kinase [Agarivorans sp. Toyoura001]
MLKQTIVVKLGTSVLTGGTSKLDRAHMIELVRQCALLRKAGHQLIVVSSGAIAAGREHLSLTHNNIAPTIANKQMLAAVGQSRLIQTWESLFGIYDMHVGQMLLTRADLEDHERFLNAKDMLKALLKHGIVPIINENDAVATAEIKVGDNDNLSALAAILGEANKLLLLTDQPGLYTADPRNNSDAKLIEVVPEISASIIALAGGSVGGLGTGGMATKLQAAEVAGRAGVEVIIAAGHAENVITRLVEGESVGTRFPTSNTSLENRKQWILAGFPPEGELVLDDGACKAIMDCGSSLLPKGITAIRGKFSRGDVVRIVDSKGLEVARGVCRYQAKAMDLIKGLHSEKIEETLGYGYGPVAVHRDDLVLK